jgi:hypothetical protein
MQVSMFSLQVWNVRLLWLLWGPSHQAELRRQ